MPLLNYTTEVPASRSIGQITSALVAAGASEVLTSYEAGAPAGLAFVLPTPHGLRQYRLPVDVAAVEKVLERQRVAPRYRTRPHAERVAWRILKDWMEAQLAIASTQMVAIDEVMLPYMLIGESTVYDLYLTQQLALGPGAMS